MTMNIKIESMYFDSFLRLVDKPDEVRPIGYKWLYKRKREIDEKVETFKAGLVAILKSNMILLSIATVLDYQICQINIKTSFLNRYIGKTIYMVQP